MNKFNLILVALLAAVLLVSVAFAESGNNNGTGNTDDTLDDSDGTTDDSTDELDVTDSAELEETEETEISEEEAEDNTDTVTGKIKPYIRTLLFSGTGIASNPSDALDFFIVKIVGGKVVLADKNIVGRGVLYLDKTKYRLTELTIEGDNAKAKIFSVDGNNTIEVGNLSLTKIAKPGADVWAGTMVLNSKTYNFYLISHKRMFKAPEIAEKARNYCQTHPYDETCKSVAGYLCKEDTEDCRMKVYSYCEDHSDDARCKDIVKKFCSGNMRDERCRDFVSEYCKENPESAYCKNEVVDFCKNNPKNEKCKTVFTDYCEKHPREQRCQAGELAFCKENPSAEKCVPLLKQHCEYNQTSAECGGVKIDYCTENPEAERCLANATSLCQMQEFMNSEKCSKIVEQAKERVEQAIKNRVNR